MSWKPIERVPVSRRHNGPVVKLRCAMSTAWCFYFNRRAVDFFGVAPGQCFVLHLGFGDSAGRLKLTPDDDGDFQVSAGHKGSARLPLGPIAGLNQVKHRGEKVAVERDGPSLVIALPNWARLASPDKTPKAPLSRPSDRDMAPGLMGDPPPSRAPRARSGDDT